jgi:hypothetical protein
MMSIVYADTASSVATSERLLLTPDEMDAKTDRQLRDLIKGLIDSVETGTRDGRIRSPSSRPRTRHQAANRPDNLHSVIQHVIRGKQESASR